MERYHTKGKVWSGIKVFWSIQNSYPIISSINKLSKRKAAKGMSIFCFSTLYTIMPHYKPLYVLNEITDFAFKGGTRDYITVYNSRVFWSELKSKTGRSYSFQKGIFLINNSFFQIGPKIFYVILCYFFFVFFMNLHGENLLKILTLGLQKNLTIFLGLFMIFLSILRIYKDSEFNNTNIKISKIQVQKKTETLTKSDKFFSKAWRRGENININSKVNKQTKKHGKYIYGA